MESRSFARPEGSGGWHSADGRLRTVNGGIGFTRAKLWLYPAGHAFNVMHDLHRAARIARADGEPLLAAAKGFRRTHRALMGDLLAIADPQRLALFARLLGAVDRLRSLEGLTTAYLSGLNTAGALGEDGLVRRAVELWRAFGHTAGAGYLVDGRALTVAPVGASSVRALAPGGAHGDVLGRDAAHLGLRIREAGLVDMSAAQTAADDCREALRAGLGLVGAALDGRLHTPGEADAPHAWGADAPAADLLGNFVCCGFEPAEAAAEPNGDDPLGPPFAADPLGRSVLTGACPEGAGVASLMSLSSAGVWVCHGMAQLDAEGRMAVVGPLGVLASAAASGGARSAPAIEPAGQIGWLDHGVETVEVVRAYGRSESWSGTAALIL